jgi:hypothetical protein
MGNRIMIVSTAQEVFDWIKANGGDAGKDWHPLPARQDDPKHLYTVEMRDGHQVEFDAPTEEISKQIWLETF